MSRERKEGARCSTCALSRFGEQEVWLCSLVGKGGGGFSLFFFDERRWLRESLVCLTAVSTHGARNHCKSRRGSL